MVCGGGSMTDDFGTRHGALVTAKASPVPPRALLAFTCLSAFAVLAGCGGPGGDAAPKAVVASSPGPTLRTALSSDGSDGAVCVILADKYYAKLEPLLTAARDQGGYSMSLEQQFILTTVPSKMVTLHALTPLGDASRRLYDLVTREVPGMDLSAVAADDIIAAFGDIKQDCQALGLPVPHLPDPR